MSNLDAKNAEREQYHKFSSFDLLILKHWGPIAIVKLETSVLKNDKMIKILKTNLPYCYREIERGWSMQFFILIFILILFLKMKIKPSVIVWLAYVDLKAPIICKHVSTYALDPIKMYVERTLSISSLSVLYINK